MEWWCWALEHSRGVPAPGGLMVCAVPEAWVLGRGQEARGRGARPCAVPVQWPETGQGHCLPREGCGAGLGADLALL